MVSGLLAAAGTLVCWTAGTFSFLTASRRIDPALLNRTRLLLAAGSTGTLACLLHGLWPWDLVAGATPMAWLMLGLSGLVGLTIGDHTGFMALRILGARRQSVVTTIAPAVAAVFAWPILGEELTATSVIGMVLSIGGVMVAMGRAAERDAVHRDGYGSFRQGVVLAVIAAACQGAGVVLAKLGMTNVAPLHATFMRMTVGFASVYAVDKLRGARLRPMRQAFADRTGRNAMMLGAFFGPTVGVTLSLVAVSTLDVAVAQTIFSMVPILVLVIAAVVQRERLHPTTIFGALVAVLGVVLLAAPHLLLNLLPT